MYTIVYIVTKCKNLACIRIFYSLYNEEKNWTRAPVSYLYDVVYVLKHLFNMGIEHKVAAGVKQFLLFFALPIIEKEDII